LVPNPDNGDKEIRYEDAMIVAYPRSYAESQEDQLSRSAAGHVREQGQSETERDGKNFEDYLKVKNMTLSEAAKLQQQRRDQGIIKSRDEGGSSIEEAMYMLGHGDLKEGAKKLREIRDRNAGRPPIRDAGKDSTNTYFETMRILQERGNRKSFAFPTGLGKTVREKVQENQASQSK
jgi:hypothetical protein